jgi:hypothetical protein
MQSFLCPALYMSTELCHSYFISHCKQNIFRDIIFTVETFKRVVIKSFIDYNIYFQKHIQMLPEQNGLIWVYSLQVCVINFLVMGSAINHLQRFKSSGLLGCFTVFCYQFTWHSNWDDLNIHQNCCGNLKFRIIHHVLACYSRFCYTWCNSKEDFVQ